MRLRKEIFAVLYVCILLLNDPQIARAYTLELQMGNTQRIENTISTMNPFIDESDKTSIHLVYALNGGTNSVYNPDVISRTELPFSLDVPVRPGYNFAGWYTDSTYTNKIS